MTKNYNLKSWLRPRWANNSSTTSECKSEHDPRATDLVVVVMGVLGSGKTTFIQNAISHKTDTLQESSTPNDTVHSEQDKITFYRLPESSSIWGDRIVLVDTPGFQDDPSLGRNTEERVIGSIEAAINKRYQGMTPSGVGIIYLHPVAGTSLRGNPAGPASWCMRRLLRIGGEVNKFERLVIATTMWDELPSGMGYDERTEGFLEDVKCLKPDGRPCDEYKNTSGSAWKIMELVLKAVGNLERPQLAVDTRSIISQTSTVIVDERHMYI